MKRFSWFMGAVVMLSLTALQPALKADAWDRKTVITISPPLEVPGVVLPAGTYVMKLLDSSSNRHIVQIMNERQSQQLALTLAIPAERLRPSDKTLLTTYEGSQGAPPALRTWFYPGDTVGQEFLYSHRQAVRIAEKTGVTVPEVETGKAATVATAVLAAHRDTFFRPLRDIRVGDLVKIHTLSKDSVYIVESARVVEPDEVDVLKPTPGPALTLITCYPFRYIGPAPERFVVRAVLAR